ncbi:MAG: hypothetical protein QOG68_1579, partial [Solirubrobacteraceae bacterium]|nr:hypothetical protein [Solirubrobacteraceae bacterium]
MSAPTGLPRLLRGITGRALTLEQHRAVHGPLPELGRRSAAGVLDAIEASGVRGRGGAHVSAALKLRALAGRRRAVIVANGAESEPASRKDATLLTQTPHLVVDGLVAAAVAVGARDGILYVKGESAAYRAAQHALAERRGSDPVAIALAAAPATYVAGQETAAIAHLSGRPALPSTVPPRPFERGVDGRPTVVSNVETLAHIGLIVRHGPDWFRAVGWQNQPGTALVTLSGAVARPGVYETAFHTGLGDLLEVAGGLTQPAQAILVGGYGGTWLAGRDMPGLLLSEGDPLLRAGSIGAGVLVVLGADACGLHESAQVLDYMAAQSARQCGPCLHGLHAIGGAFSKLADGTADADAEE